MEKHYKEVYVSNNPGFAKMKVKLRELSDYAKENNIKIYLLMTPDIHNLFDYKYKFIHEKMNKIAEEYNYVYIDPLPRFLGKDSITLFAMPGDPHPNFEGHKIMADSIFPFLYNSDKKNLNDFQLANIHKFFHNLLFLKSNITIKI